VTEAGDPEIAHCISGHNRILYGFIHQLVERAQQNGALDPTISPDVATWGYLSGAFAKSVIESKRESVEERKS